MSTYPQYTLQSHAVYTFTINTLEALPLRMPGVIHSRDLLRVLVFAAASRLSVHQACAQLECAPSGPTVLGTLAGQCSDLAALEGHVHDQPWPVAVGCEVLGVRRSGFYAYQR